MPANLFKKYPVNVTKLNLAKQIPLRVILIVPFVLQISAAVGLVGYLSFRNGQRAVNDLANQLVDKASQQVSDHLDSYVAIPQKLNQVNADAISAGQLNLNDPIASELYFWRQAKVFQNLAYTGYTLTDGSEVGAARWYGGTAIQGYENRPGEGKASEYKTDAQGKRSGLLQTYVYKPLAEPWYSQTVKAGKPIWSQIYTATIVDAQISQSGKSLQSNLAEDNQTYVTASAKYPFYNAKHQLLGILNIDLTLTDIGNFLRSLKASPSGQVFIVERDGTLVSSSSSQPIFHRVNDTTERFSAFSSPDPIVHAVALVVQKQFRTFRDIHTKTTINISINGQRQFAQITPWRDPYGLDWLLVVLVPESDFMGQIHDNNTTTIQLCLGALAVAILLGIYTSNWITQPILRLSHASEAIASGNLDQQVQHSNVKELEILVHSFNHMATQLRESFEALGLTNSQLEQRVEERTSELQTMLGELHRVQGQMIQAEKMSSLGQLVAGVAHEINNPVNFIYGNTIYMNDYAQSLLELVALYQSEYPNPTEAIQHKSKDIDLNFISEDFLKLILSMQVGAERIQEIVKSLRTFSRLDESERKQADIHEGLESTLLILRYRLTAESDRLPIEVVREYSELPPIECFPGQLNQVFMNILSNAIDALEEKANQLPKTTKENEDCAYKITICTSNIDLNWIKISIADNGSGMSEDIQRQIFNPFYTTKPVGAGTGLGLSISYQIIEKHGGNLECHSTLGAGTEFVIRIPALIEE
jgi:signal transduction histidine kinase